MPAALRMLNQPSSRCFGCGCVTRSSLKSGKTACSTSVETSSPRPTAASTSSTSLRASRCSTGFRLSLEKLLPARSKARSRMRSAEAGILLADGVLGGPADGGARLAGDDDRFPGGRRHLRLGADDLDLVAVLQFGHQRHDAAVDLGADAGVADIGVDGIGEVDRRGAARQRDQHALRREAEDLVLEQLELGVFEEVLRVVAFGQLLDGAPQPGIGVGLRSKSAWLAPFALPPVSL